MDRDSCSEQLAGNQKSRTTLGETTRADTGPRLSEPAEKSCACQVSTASTLSILHWLVLAGGARRSQDSGGEGNSTKRHLHETLTSTERDETGPVQNFNAARRKPNKSSKRTLVSRILSTRSFLVASVRESKGKSEIV